MTVVVEVDKGFTGAFDERIVKVGIEIEGEVLFFDGLDIRAQGQKFADAAVANFCTIKISNLTRDQRNYILSKATPFQRVTNGKIDPTSASPVFITLDVGRQSYGTFRLFEGYAYVSSVTQPPDLGIVLRSQSQSELNGLTISYSAGAVTGLKTIAQSVATQCNLILDYKVTREKQISNFTYTGAASRLPERLAMLADIIVHVDNGTMYVYDNNKNRSDANFLLSQDTGMVGVPQGTENGVLVQALINPGLLIGGGVTINSIINPGVNGSNYNIKQMTFDVANRDDPFFYTMQCVNNFFAQGTV